ncbi:N-acetylglucosaminyl-phosphatidylinositol de-N-acetylase [Thalassophryne amazonica]|uniref:N-acetylglucosaminyl-phosphatidylinositol de-N-acetylase n=1 Tax=Thalassophryne amazonica TaxID=390379 RepID=UPI001471DC8A|nr:N-acetylglucosaminyl-phosphatidylinositol de-N-acetylase [Thalassophryne amazonica]
MIVSLLVVAFLFCLFLIIGAYYRLGRISMESLRCLMCFLSSRERQSDVRALIVTAHPDDECLFFAPTIIRLVQLRASVHLLCLSAGNYYNQGSERKEELVNSCAVLGIPASRVTIIDHEKLPDDPEAEWSTSLVSSLIVKHLNTHSFNMVLTFDRRGVSGHANHIAIYKAVSHLASSGQISDDCCLLSLVTVGVFRKYLSFLELPLSWLLPSSFCCILHPDCYKQATAAMLCHRTQLLWFRYLYIIFSRYMLVNTFQIIPQGPKNLKIN